MFFTLIETRMTRPLGMGRSDCHKNVGEGAARGSDLGNDKEK
jgi:hypothetical protein